MHRPPDPERDEAGFDQIATTDEGKEMSNLGLYENLVIAVKNAGGVENYIRSVEIRGAAKAVPLAHQKGVATGVALAGVGMTLVLGGVVVGQKFLDRRKADQEAAAETRTQLASEVAIQEGKAGDDGSQPTSAGDLV